MMMTTSILQCGVFNPFSSAGIIGTSRIGMDGQYNVAYGVDGTFRLYGDDYLTFQWAHTFDEKEVFQRGSRPSESGRFSAEFEKRLQDGFGYETGFVWSGPDYYPGMGFIQRTDFTQSAVFIHLPTWRRIEIHIQSFFDRRRAFLQELRMGYRNCTAQLSPFKL